jgi:hypothetical protein
MLAKQHESEKHHSRVFADAELPKHELLEIHRSKISLHHAKEDYSYPMIRLPHTLSVLAGLPTRIYQTIHEGGLAFSWSFHQKKKHQESQKRPS